MSLISLYIPCKDEQEARSISKHLLQVKLIACSNIWPVRSLYMWKDELVDESEVVLLAKSIDKNYKKIKEQVMSIHSYDIPAIVKIPIETNQEYEKWLRNEVTNE